MLNIFFLKQNPDRKGNLYFTFKGSLEMLGNALRLLSVAGRGREGSETDAEKSGAGMCAKTQAA